MSQSDYIQYKKTQQILKRQNKLSHVLSPNEYTNFQQYAMETNVPNTKLRHSRLIPPSTILVLDMEKTTNNCPSFIMCKNTSERPNRVKNTTSIPIPTYRPNKIYNPSLCTFTVGHYKTRTCPCSKTICKCGTTICNNTS